MARVTSMYYEIFKKEEKKGVSGLYEKICNSIPKVLKMDTDFGLGERFNPILDQAQLSLKTEDVVTLALYVMLSGFVLTILTLSITEFSLFLFGVLIAMAMFENHDLRLMLLSNT